MSLSPVKNPLPAPFSAKKEAAMTDHEHDESAGERLLKARLERGPPPAFEVTQASPRATVRAFRPGEERSTFAALMAAALMTGEEARAMLLAAAPKRAVPGAASAACAELAFTLTVLRANGPSETKVWPDPDAELHRRVKALLRWLPARRAAFAAKTAGASGAKGDWAAQRESALRGLEENARLLLELDVVFAAAKGVGTTARAALTVWP
jgi:hypothetical protein